MDGIGHGRIRPALDWWESGGRPGADKGVNHWSGLVQTVLAEFRAELNRSLSADRRFLAGVELDWYLRNLDGVAVSTRTGCFRCFRRRSRTNVSPRRSG